VAAVELEQVLRGYGLPLSEDATPTVVTARVLHLPTPDGGLAIKVFAAEQHAQARIEASLLDHLDIGEGRGAGYRVQQLLRTPSGQTLLPQSDRLVLVTRWQQGFHRSYREIDAPHWSVLGRTLAALHLRLDEAPPLPLRRFVDDLRTRDLDHDRRLLEAHLHRATTTPRPDAPLVQRYLADRIALFDLHAHPCQTNLPPADAPPIHNDYNVHNYLFHDHGPPTILDWERAIRAPRELEVCRCLAHLPLVAPTSAWAFIEGYLALRSLDPELVAWALRACITLHALKHWPVESWLAGEPGSSERVAGMAEIVRSFVESRPRWDAFAAQLLAHVRAPHPRRP